MSYPRCPISPAHIARLVRPVLALSLISACSAALSGCHGYRFDTKATNTTSENVRISIYKGKRHVKISSVIAAPGSVVSWTGQTQKPVVVRAEPANFAPGVGQMVEVSLPRRVHTDLTITSPDQNLKIISSQPMAACCQATDQPADTASLPEDEDYAVIPNAPQPQTPAQTPAFDADGNQSDTPDTPANTDEEQAVPLIDLIVEPDEESEHAVPADPDARADDDSDDSDSAVDIVEEDNSDKN